MIDVVNSFWKDYCSFGKEFAILAILIDFIANFWLFNLICFVLHKICFIKGVFWELIINYILYDLWSLNYLLYLFVLFPLDDVDLLYLRLCLLHQRWLMKLWHLILSLIWLFKLLLVICSICSGHVHMVLLICCSAIFINHRLLLRDFHLLLIDLIATGILWRIF